MDKLKDKESKEMIKTSNDAVSTLVGTILLLLIAICAMSVIYLTVLSDEGPENQRFVTVVGTVEGTNMIIEHHGGESIPIDEVKLDVIFLGQTLHVDPNTDLSPQALADGYWGLGERIVIPFPLENLTYDDYDDINAEIIAIDEEKNEISFIGNLELDVVSDVAVRIKSNNTSPDIGQRVLFTLSVTNPEGVVDAKNVTIFFQLPDSFIYVGHFAENGTYNHNSGLWRMGDITINQDSIDLEITSIFNGSGEMYEITQLSMLVDGSGSVRTGDWNIMRTGLSMAVKDPTVFPHDGSVELNIIQFAKNGAFLEIGPTVITSGNANNVANSIANLNQRKGGTPLGCAFKKAADTFVNSPNFDPNYRQVVNIVTDGMPNRDCVSTPGVYSGSDVPYEEGKASAEYWRDYLITTCLMTEEQDEIDSLAVGILSGYYTSGPDSEWLNSSIIWPVPGCIAPPFDAGRSWVREVASWEDFYNATKEMFRIIFQGVWVTSEIFDTYPNDPNETNDRTQVLIVPESP